MNGPPGKGSNGSEYAHHVRGILDRVAELEARVQEQERRPAGGSLLTRTPVVGLVTLIFGAVVMWNIQSVRAEVEPLPPGAREASLQVSAMVLTAAVESYRETNGGLPASLEELGFPPGVTPEFEFVRRGEEFDIVVSMGGTRMRYRSEEGQASLLPQVTTGGPDR